MGVGPSSSTWGTHHGSTPLNITDSPSPSSHRLLLVPQLRVWAGVLILHPGWDGDWLGLLQALCRQPQLLRFSEWSCPVMLRRCWFKVPSPLNSLALHFFLPSSRMLPEWALEGGGACRRPVCGCSFHRHLLCNLTSCKSLNWLLSNWTNMLLWWDLRDALICGHRGMHLEGNLILCPISKIIVILKARHSLTTRIEVSAFAASWILPLWQPKVSSHVIVAHLFRAP